VSPFRVYNDELTIVGSMAVLRSFGAAVDLLASGAVAPGPLLGEPLPLVRQRVAQAIALIRAEAPQARIALLTVFPGRSHPALADRTDQAIVTAAQAADHDVIIMDPLTGRWAYSRSHDRLHPTAGGDLQIAQKVAAALRAQGLVPGPAGRGGFVCDTAIGIRPPQPR